MRRREINSHAELRSVFRITFKCFCKLTFFPLAPTAAATATAKLYLPLTLTVGACSPSAEEVIPETETCRQRDKTWTGDLHALSPEVVIVAKNLVKLASQKVCGFTLAVRTMSSSAEVRESKWHGSRSQYSRSIAYNACHREIKGEVG